MLIQAGQELPQPSMFETLKMLRSGGSKPLDWGSWCGLAQMAQQAGDLPKLTALLSSLAQHSISGAGPAAPGAAAGAAEPASAPAVAAAAAAAAAQPLLQPGGQPAADLRDGGRMSLLGFVKAFGLANQELTMHLLKSAGGAAVTAGTTTQADLDAAMEWQRKRFQLPPAEDSDGFMAAASPTGGATSGGLNGTGFADLATSALCGNGPANPDGAAAAGTELSGAGIGATGGTGPANLDAIAAAGAMPGDSSRSSGIGKRKASAALEPARPRRVC